MDGRQVPIEEILVQQVSAPVYNFHVHGLHNYAVGRNSVLVHNNCSAQQLATNRQSGKAAEALVKKELQQLGFNIVGSQVSVITQLGRRVIDHLVELPNGTFVAIEVKAGQAVRRGAQLAKDASMALHGAVIIGKNADPNVLEAVSKPV